MSCLLSFLSGTDNPMSFLVFPCLFLAYPLYFNYRHCHAKYYGRRSAHDSKAQKHKT
nr:MAG TPA: hypothetical protein [Caudoviricetes sp.]